MIECVLNLGLLGERLKEVQVDLLYNQLTKKKDWVEALARADAVFVATHSQGSIVSTHLLARLIEQKQVTASHVSMVCMAAVAAGPCSSLVPYYCSLTMLMQRTVTHLNKNFYF